MRILEPIIITLLSTVISGHVLSEGSYIDAGSNALLATRDIFTIRVSDQVKDGCLPRPNALKDKFEIGMRRNNFAISGPDIVYNEVLIYATGFDAGDGLCAVFLSAEYSFLVTVTVPYSKNTSDDSFDKILLLHTDEIGGALLTGPRSSMQSRLEKKMEVFSDKLFLNISRAKDLIKKDYPYILENKKKFDSDK